MQQQDIIFAVLMALAVGYMLYKRRGNLSSEAAHKLVDEGALLVDVRSPAEFGSGHIKGAINIPVQDIGRRMKELGDDKERPVVLYCASGARSGSAANMLRSAGFANVHNLGAKSRW